MMSRKSILRHELERPSLERNYRMRNKLFGTRLSFSFKEFRGWEDWVVFITTILTMVFVGGKALVALMLGWPIINFIACLFGLFLAPFFCIFMLPGMFIVWAIKLFVYGDIYGEEVA